MPSLGQAAMCLAHVWGGRGFAPHLVKGRLSVCMYNQGVQRTVHAVSEETRLGFPMDGQREACRGASGGSQRHVPGHLERLLILKRKALAPLCREHLPCGAQVYTQERACYHDLGQSKVTRPLLRCFTSPMIRQSS